MGKGFSAPHQIALCGHNDFGQVHAWLCATNEQPVHGSALMHRVLHCELRRLMVRDTGIQSYHPILLSPILLVAWKVVTAWPGGTRYPPEL